MILLAAAIAVVGFGLWIGVINHLLYRGTGRRLGQEALETFISALDYGTVRVYSNVQSLGKKRGVVERTLTGIYGDGNEFAFMIRHRVDGAKDYVFDRASRGLASERHVEARAVPKFDIASPLARAWLKLSRLAEAKQNPLAKTSR